MNQDTLLMDITYRMTDSTGVLVNKTDSAQEILSKEPYVKRMKEQEEELAAWTKKQEKRRRKANPTIR